MKNTHILLVDDSKNLLESISRSLRKQEFWIETAENANDALEILQQTHVQLIISDYMMPGMNGIELLSKVKTLYPKIIRILLTGQTDLTVAISAINAGTAFRYLAKPTNTGELITIIHQGLDYYQMSETIETLTKETFNKNKELAKLNKELQKSNKSLSSANRLTDKLLDSLPVAVILVQSNYSLFFANKTAMTVMPSLSDYDQNTDIKNVLPADIIDILDASTVVQGAQNSSRMLLDGKVIKVHINAIKDDTCFVGWLLSFGTQDISSNR